MKRVSLLGALLLATTATTAAAQPSGEATDDAPTRGDLDRRDRSSVSGTIGLMAPTGSIGLEYAHAFHENLEVAAGAGVGYLLLAVADSEDYRATAHAAIMPRYRIRFGALRLHVGAGLSAGEEQEGRSPFSGEKGVDRAYMLLANLEGGAQVMSRDGWFGRATFGYGRSLAHTEPVSTEPGREPNMDLEYSLPYFGLAVGRTL